MHGVHDCLRLTNRLAADDARACSERHRVALLRRDAATCEAVAKANVDRTPGRWIQQRVLHRNAPLPVTGTIAAAALEEVVDGRRCCREVFTVGAENQRFSGQRSVDHPKPVPVMAARAKTGSRLVCAGALQARRVTFDLLSTTARQMVRGRTLAGRTLRMCVCTAKHQRRRWLATSAKAVIRRRSRSRRGRLRLDIRAAAC